MSDACNLALLRLDPRDGNTLVLQRPHHAFFLTREKKQQATALTFVPCSASYTMNIRVCVLGRIQLHYPVYGGKVKAARGDVGRKEERLGASEKALVNV